MIWFGVLELRVVYLTLERYQDYEDRHRFPRLTFVQDLDCERVISTRMSALGLLSTLYVPSNNSNGFI